MATRSYTSRRELEEYHFNPLAVVLVPLALIALQALLPRLWPPLIILDLPLIAVIFFSVARRNPIFGALTGSAIGLVQDALTGNPVGIYGICKSLIGYAGSSIGIKVDVENLTTRLLMNFVFSLLQSALLFLIHRYLLGDHTYRERLPYEVLKAAVNTAVAIPLFLLLDRLKQRE